MVAFGLMSVIPLLVLGYVVTVYVLPNAGNSGELSLVLGLALGLALLGFWVARSFVFPLIRLASQVQEIAQGHLERRVEVSAPDEVGSIGVALNQITQRVRENMAQLRVYGEQTKHLNLEINRRILTLSHLLQVSNLIAQSAKVEDVITFILEKLTQLDEAELNLLLEGTGEGPTFAVRMALGNDLGRMQQLQGARVTAPWLAKLLRERRAAAIDSVNGTSVEREALEQLFGMTNAYCQPILSVGQGIGLLISANRKPDFVFREDCLELLQVFAKQMTIAMENDLLAKRAEELKVIDELTGLYNAGYIHSRLEEEIRRALRYHRSCSLVLVNVDDFTRIREQFGPLAGEGVIHQVAELLKGQVREVDRAGRTGTDEFAVILPETNKREAIEFAERLREAVEKNIFMNGNARLPGSLHVSAGVSENPLDGASDEELFRKASEAMHSAKRTGKNRVLAA